MATVSLTARRALLTPGALALLCRQGEVSPPPEWLAVPAPGDAELLERAGLAQAPPHVLAGLQPWSDPLLTVRTTLAHLRTTPPTPATRPATAFTSLVTVGQQAQVALLRRDGLGLVELSLSAPESLADELRRVLDQAGSAPAPAAPLQVAPPAFTALSSLTGRLDVGGLARTTGTPPEQVAAVAEVLGSTTRTLEVLVVGRETGTVGARLWYDAGGWWQVTAEPSAVRLVPGVPAVEQVAALVAGALR